MSNKFEFSDICYTVNCKKKGIKTILSEISGVCRAGEVMAILGPSGAGKTSLLNVLTLNALSGVSKGMCQLNGVNITDKIFREHCCIVPQEDHHRAFLTARQTLMYVADFYIQGSDETKKKEVDTLITKLGLDVCADTLVGNQFFVGLSGGQKKRLSVAVALLKKPSVMMLDEPTSGLDAASSFHVMKFIKALTKERGICTICTIHQPSSPIYMDFDNVMLLSQGRCAFLGTPERSITYFDEKGYNMPKFSNPAEYLLDCINNDFTDAADVAKILNLWSASEATELANKTGGTVATNTALPPDRESIPFKLQFWYLLRRQAHVVATDPMIYIGRAIMFLIACVFFAIVYVESRDRIQEQILNRLWLTMWLVGVPTSLGVIGVYAFNEEFKTLRKEVKNGMFKINAFLAAIFVLQVPVMFILALFAVGIPAFAIGNLNPAQFFPITLMYTCILFTYESIGRAFSVGNENPLLGMLNFLQVWFTSFLFAGVMIPEDMVIWPLRIFCYIMPLKWGISTIAWLDAHDMTYGGAWKCDPDERSDCLYHKEDGEIQEPGWTCAKNEGGAYSVHQCYGYSGDQVLDSLGENYDVVSSDNHVARNFGAVIGIGLGFQLFYNILCMYRIGLASTISLDNPGTKRNNDQVSDVEMAYVSK